MFVKRLCPFRRNWEKRKNGRLLSRHLKKKTGPRGPGNGENMAKEQVSTTLRALQVLECFVDQDTEWTLKELVSRTGLPTTTVYRQLSTLTELRYLEQDPVHKSYRVGPRLLMLAGAILGQSDLRTTARPVMERLSESVEETINLSALLEHDIFYLDKVETRRSIACNTRVGSRVNAHCTSCGKVLLAYQPQETVEEYLRWMRRHARPVTENTIMDPERLRQELVQARVNGYATECGETESGLICVAAPIYDMNAQVTAAISVSGPEFRMRENEDRIIREVCDAAQDVSYLMGYRARR